MSENKQVLDVDTNLDSDYEIKVEQLPSRSDNYSAGAVKNDGLLAKVAIGALIGASLGAIAAALTNKGTAERVNQTIKGVGNTVKRAATGVNDTVKDVGDAVKNVATGVNDTVKDVGESVKGAATGVNDTVKSTVDAVKGTAVDVNDTVKGTVDAVKGAADEVKRSTSTNPNQGVKPSEKQRAYLLVPVEDEEAVE